MKIHIVVIPQDYQSAEAIPFKTEDEAMVYVANEVDAAKRHYVTVQEWEI